MLARWATSYRPVSVRLGGVSVTSRYCVEADERIELKTGGSTLGRARPPSFWHTEY